VGSYDTTHRQIKAAWVQFECAHNFPKVVATCIMPDRTLLSLLSTHMPAHVDCSTRCAVSLRYFARRVVHLKGRAHEHDELRTKAGRSSDE
jgi:hypothetical protein